MIPPDEREIADAFAELRDPDKQNVSLIAVLSAADCCRRHGDLRACNYYLGVFEGLERAFGRLDALARQSRTGRPHATPPVA